MKNYFKTKKQIEADFKNAFSLLKTGKEKQALKSLEKTFLNAPYEAEIHFELAKYFAQNKNIASAIEHLEICFDLDEKWLKKAKKDPIISKNISAEKLHNIEKDKLSRWWQVIQIDQIEPFYQNFSVDFKIKPKYYELVSDLSESMPERVMRYFRLEDSENKSEGEFSILKLNGDVDRCYCGYGKLYQTIKRLSAYVKDVHFFMSSENVSWLDEIKIRNGKFYFYRHFVKSSYSDDKLALISKLSHQNNENKFLKRFLSQRFIEYASFYINDMGENKADEPEMKSMAQEYLKKALKFNPNDPEIYYQQSRYFEKLGKTEKAKKSLFKTLDCSPKHFSALYDLGQCFMLEKNYKEALKYFNKVRGIEPDYNKIHFLKGQAYELIGEVTKAKKEYEKDIQNTQIKDIRILVNTGNTLANKQLGDSAIFYHEIALEKSKLYQKELEKKIRESERKNPDPHSDIGWYYKGQLESISEVRVAAYLGISYVNGELKNDFKKGLKYCEKVLKIDPKSKEALYSKGTLLIKMQKLEEASEYFDQKDDIKAMNNKAFILFHQKNWREVIAISKKILKKHSNYVNSYISLGGAYINIKKYQEALDAYLTGLKYEPHSEKCWQGAGLAYGWLKQYKKAIECNKKLLKFNPNNYIVLSDIGSALNNLGEYKEALKYVNKSIELNQNYYHSYYVKACIFALTGRVTEAGKMIKKTLSLDPAQRINMQNEVDFKKIINDPVIQKILF